MKETSTATLKATLNNDAFFTTSECAFANKTLSSSTYGINTTDGSICCMGSRNWTSPVFSTVVITNKTVASGITDVKILVPNKVVEVTFTDGKKEKSVCREPDIFSLETAIAICISKKLLGGTGVYNNTIKHGVKVYKDKVKKETADKAEQERIKKKRAKRQAYMERRTVKKEQAEREKQIAIQREAFIQAMEYMNSSKNVANN